jgi:hypothetical protein
MRVSAEWSQGFYYVVHDAAGRLVAQGSREMCERVAAGLPLIGKQGDLFGA